MGNSFVLAALFEVLFGGLTVDVTHAVELICVELNEWGGGGVELRLDDRLYKRLLLVVGLGGGLRLSIAR